MTQHERVLQHLRDYGSITSMEAFVDYGITRLSAVIFDLRAEGFQIDMERISGKNRYGERVNYGKYSLNERQGA